MLSTPVLFLTYKRFETTVQVFEAIRRARPKHLYFASNAPDPRKPDDHEKVARVRALLDTVDWDCTIHRLFRDEHLPVKISIPTAIDWFFEQEEEGIILEDDCLPSPDFFRFVEELLPYYRTKENVMCIGGSNFHDDQSLHRESYYFSRLVNIWGWATWRRAWEKYDVNMSKWPAYRNTNWIGRIFTGIIKRKYWKRIFDMVYNGAIATWDYQWVFSVWDNNGYCIIPARNLISNIGFGADATFTKNVENADANRPHELLQFPLTHPVSVKQDLAADEYVSSAIYKINFRTVFLDQTYALYKKLF